MSRIVHFEIPVDEPDRALAFYSNVFGWKTEKWEGPMEYWLAVTGPDGEPGINGAFTRRNDPGQSLVNVIDVSNIDDAIARVTRHGGVIVVPKFSIPYVGWVAYFKDPEGNITGMNEKDDSVK
jgi:uncharacterized protein